MAALGNNVVLFGGRSEESQQVFSDTWVFDGTRWTQMAPGNSPSPRWGHVMAALGAQVVLFGGRDPNGDLADTWDWDGRTWRVRQVSAAPPARMGASMAARAIRLVMFGGLRGMENLADTWLFDGGTWTQRSITAPQARRDHTLATLGNDLLLFGGEGSVALDDVWLYR